MKKTKKLTTQNSESKFTALYVRVSTDAQYEEGYSIDVQTEKLKQWCLLKGIERFRVYEDGGWSGSNIKRPAMEQMLFHIQQGLIERVIVYKLDRLSRSQKDTLFLLEEMFLPNGVEFVSLNENLETDSPLGKAMIGVLSVFAQLERENIKERTRMGMYQRVKEGYWPGGGLIPFGYDYDANQNILIPNGHAEQVKQIFDLYLKGYSTSQLANIFPVASDRHIVSILERVTYLGKIPYKGEIFDGKHEPLIEVDVFNAVQQERKRRTKTVISSQYLLTGLLYCGKCGAKLRYQKWGREIVKVYCYSQQTSKPNLIKNPNCDNMKYLASDIEEIVINDLFKITQTISVNRDSSNSVEEKLNATKIIESQKKALENKIKNQYNLYAENPSDLLLETIRTNEAELKKLTKMVENEMNSVEAIKDISEKTKMLSNLKNLWDDLSFEEKREVVTTCIEKIILTDEEINIHYLI